MSQGAGGEWRLIQIDEKMAKRQGIPMQIPVPKSEFEGLAEKGIQMDALKKWISAFLTAAPTSWRQQNGALAKRYVLETGSSRVARCTPAGPNRPRSIRSP